MTDSLENFRRLYCRGSVPRVESLPGLKYVEDLIPGSDEEQAQQDEAAHEDHHEYGGEA